MPVKFVGLDGEMTGTYLNKHQLCQIGIAAENSLFVSDIGWQEYATEETALKVNGFTAERIEAGPTPGEVDDLLYNWLRWISDGRDYRFIAVGWNVGSFDMPFVRATLPKSSELFSRRSVDLNAVCFTIGSTNKYYSDPRKSPPKWAGWKRMAKRYATELLGEENWHDAGYDAAAGYLSWEYLIRSIGEPKAWAGDEIVVIEEREEEEVEL